MSKKAVSPRVVNSIIEALVFAAIVLGSLFQGIFSQDYHHYGLMLSNASDLSSGKLPYKDIFIQYGILTTLVHGLAYTFFKSTLALTGITALFYAAGILILKKIYDQCYPKNKFGIYFLLVCCLFHPVIFLPWSNYISFPFLMLSILILVAEDRVESLVKNILCGISFGLAILAREGNIVAVAIFIFASMTIDFFQYKKSLKKVLIRYGVILMGMILVLMPFFIYLTVNKLFFYWKIHAIDLPKVYAEVVFPNINFYKFYLRFFKQLIIGILNFDVRWLLIGAILFVNFLGIYKFIFSKTRAIDAVVITKLSIASLALLVSMLHIPEIFRFASGGILGLILLFGILEKKPWGILCIFFMIGALSATLFSGTSGVKVTYQFFQNQHKLRLVDIEGFKGLVWPDGAAIAYKKISLDLTKLKSNPCNFRYHYNATDNNFVAFLSPFSKFQLAPHNFSSDNYSSEKFDGLRPDLNYSTRILQSDDILIFDYIKNENYSSRYSDYVLYSRYDIYGEILGIFIPKKCFKF